MSLVLRTSGTWKLILGFVIDMGSGFVVHGLSEVGSMCLKSLFA